jgi:hypothetical protein
VFMTVLELELCVVALEQRSFLLSQRRCPTCGCILDGESISVDSIMASNQEVIYDDGVPSHI